MNPLSQLPLVVRELGLSNPRLVHIGAHEGQEVPFYREFTDQIVLVEPVPELAARLEDKFPDTRVFRYAVSEQTGVLPFYVLNPTNVSTLVEPGPMDRVTSVITVDVVTLDRITELSGVPDVLVVDAQGRESSVLRSGDLSETSVVVVETCTIDDPTMASPYTEVVDLMQSFGFRETDHWDRDYTFVNRFARGPEAQARPGQFVRDVVFVNANLLR